MKNYWNFIRQKLSKSLLCSPLCWSHFWMWRRGFEEFNSVAVDTEGDYRSLKWPATWMAIHLTKSFKDEEFYFKLREVINGQPQSSFSEHIYYIPRFQFFENDSHLAEIVQKNRSARILTRGQSVRHFTIFTHCLSLISTADWHDQEPSRFYYNNLKRWEKRLRVHKGLIYGEKNLSFEIFFSLNIER